MVYGFMLLLLAGLCQGSFGLGYKKYPPFSWAAFWGVYCVCCIIISGGFAAALTGGIGILPMIAERGAAYWLTPILCGAVWGLSAIGFSKGITMIGMSLVYGISMGISTIVGSVTPMVISKTVPSSGSLFFFAMGLILTLLGVVLVTAAGVKRDGGAKGSALGIVLSVLSGLGSGMMNVGFTHTEDFGAAMLSKGAGSAAVSAFRWAPVLIGGCLAGALWCAAEMSSKKEWKTLTEKGAIKRCGVLFCVAIVWYAALLLYGLSSEMLGSLGSTAGWILFNALALIISVGWGLKTGEWKGHKKGMLFAGCGVLIAAWIFTALA